MAWESWAILPNSVRSPVAKTTASQLPLKTEQPAKAILTLSASRVETASAFRVCGFASPVSGALLTTKSTQLTIRASAGIRSPSAIINTSPGTTPGAGIFLTFPSRFTNTRGGRNFCRASMAFSARYSWMKLKKALRRETPSRAQPRTFILSPGCRWSATKQMAAARSSRMVKKLVNWRISERSHLPRSETSKLFGPTSRRRSSTSLSVKPSPRLPRTVKTSGGFNC